MISTAKDRATVVFDRMSGMDIMQDDRAMNAPHTRAMTLVGTRDSGILIVTTSACNDIELQGTDLTQRGESPIILSGCCTADLALIGSDK